MAAQLVVAQ
jgi:nucleotide-binding universal stress UspA family protein